jgi:hypothetical protein
MPSAVVSVGGVREELVYVGVGEMDGKDWQRCLIAIYAMRWLVSV